MRSCGHEDVVENGHGLPAAEAEVAHVELRLLQLAGVAGLPPEDVLDAGGVGGYREGDRPVFLARPHGYRRHDDDLVGVQHARLVELGAAHDHAVALAGDDAQVEVGVGLVLGALAAVALGVGHRSVDHHVLRLNAGPVLAEAAVVVGAVLLVALVGHAEHGVGGVHADAALEAAGGHVAAVALHQHLVDQVLGALVKMGEAVDLLAGEGRPHAEQLAARLVVGAVEGGCDGSDGGRSEGMVG